MKTIFELLQEAASKQESHVVMTGRQVVLVDDEAGRNRSFLVKIRDQLLELGVPVVYKKRPWPVWPMAAVNNSDGADEDGFVLDDDSPGRTS